MGADNAKSEYPSSDYAPVSAHTEKDILFWAQGKSTWTPSMSRFDSAQIERFEVGGKNFLVLLVTPTTATVRMEILVYVGEENPAGVDNRGWALLLHRYTGTASVKVEADKSAKRLTFRSKAGKVLLILPVENVDIIAGQDER